MNCIFSPRHTQETSLCVVTQQAACLLKINHIQFLLPLVNSPYLVRVRNENLVLMGIQLCFATFYFDFEVSRLMPEVFSQSFDRQTHWLQCEAYVYQS